MVIPVFNTDAPLILGDLRYVKYSATPLTFVLMTELCNYHDTVRGVFPRAYKYLQYQRIRLQEVINRYFQFHVEEKLLTSELLGEFGVFWYQFASEIEVFHLHLLTTTYGDNVTSMENYGDKMCFGRWLGWYGGS